MACQILVDWYTVTGHDGASGYDTLLAVLGLDYCNFVDKERGRYGYAQGKYYQGINLYLSANGDDWCIECSGTGCRAAETACGLQLDWRNVWDITIANNWHITRLDVALDDHDGDLDWDTISDAMRSRCFVARSRSYYDLSRTDISSGLPLMREFLVGSPQSDKRIRIYDKALERGLTDTHWIRVEMQLRRDNAESFVRQSGRIGEVTAGVLLESLRYTMYRPSSHNQAHTPSAVWWVCWLGRVNALMMITSAGLDYNRDNLENTVRKMCASSCKAWLAMHNGDITALLDVISSARLNERQTQLLERLAYDKHGGDANY